MKETNALIADEDAAEQALYRTLTHEAVERERGRAPEIRAKNQYNRGNRLRELGWNEAALKDAVGRYRELAITSPDTFRPDLAKSLRSLLDTLKAMNVDGEALEATNLDGEALEAGREAVDLYRELDAARPGAFRPDLADSLGNLSKQPCARNRHEEALEVGREAVGLYRDTFGPETLKVGREAVNLYRDLAALRPDAFRPDLADSLGNLSKQLRARNRHEEALKVGREALGLYRELATASPDLAKVTAATVKILWDSIEAMNVGGKASKARREAVSLYLDHCRDEAGRPPTRPRR